MNSKIILSLLIVLTIAQNSGLGDSVNVGEGSSSELPSSSPPSRSTILSNNLEGSGIAPLSLSILRPQKPENWRFLLTASLGPGTKWVSPSNFKVKPLRYLARYTIKFHTDCTKAEVVFKFATTGSSFIQING